MELQSELVLELDVACSQALEVGRGKEGMLNVIPITGGSFRGRISGRVVPGGADWSTRKDERTAHVFAKYLLQADDGAYIAVENSGIVDFSRQSQYIRTSPSFTADDHGPHAWMNEGVYVGSLEPGKHENSVHIKIYKML